MRGKGVFVDASPPVLESIGVAGSNEYAHTRAGPEHSITVTVELDSRTSSRPDEIDALHSAVFVDGSRLEPVFPTRRLT